MIQRWMPGRTHGIDGSTTVLLAVGSVPDPPRNHRGVAAWMVLAGVRLPPEVAAFPRSTHLRQSNGAMRVQGSWLAYGAVGDAPCHISVACVRYTSGSQMTTVTSCEHAFLASAAC
jgi:hypothetical protein